MVAAVVATLALASYSQARPQSHKTKADARLATTAQVATLADKLMRQIVSYYSRVPSKDRTDDFQAGDTYLYENIYLSKSHLPFYDLNVRSASKSINRQGVYTITITAQWRFHQYIFQMNKLPGREGWDMYVANGGTWYYGPTGPEPDPSAKREGFLPLTRAALLAISPEAEHVLQEAFHRQHPTSPQLVAGETVP
jgi:Tfp pilus assembly protein PilE